MRSGSSLHSPLRNTLAVLMIGSAISRIVVPFVLPIGSISSAGTSSPDGTRSLFFIQASHGSLIGRNVCVSPISIISPVLSWPLRKNAGTNITVFPTTYTDAPQALVLSSVLSISWNASFMESSCGNLSDMTALARIPNCCSKEGPSSSAAFLVMFLCTIRRCIVTPSMLLCLILFISLY